MQTLRPASSTCAFASVVHANPAVCWFYLRLCGARTADYGVDLDLDCRKKRLVRVTLRTGTHYMYCTVNCASNQRPVGGAELRSKLGVLSSISVIESSLRNRPHIKYSAITDMSAVKVNVNATVPTDSNDPSRPMVDDNSLGAKLRKLSHARNELEPYLGWFWKYPQWVQGLIVVSLYLGGGTIALSLIFDDWVS